MKVGTVFCVLALLTIFWAVGVYKRLADMRMRCKAAFAQFEQQLLRRCDLVPRLVQLYIGGAEREVQTARAVLDASQQVRAVQANAAGAARNESVICELADAEKRLADALTRMFVIAQAYPDLRANPRLQSLAEDIVAMSDRIDFARQAYNHQATLFNAAIVQIPAAMIASVFLFRPLLLLGADNV